MKRREDFETTVETYIEAKGMFPDGAGILLGVSGGADSVALLLALCSLSEKHGWTLSAAHIEHGIRGEESLADAAFVQRLCEKLQVPCIVRQVDAPAYAEKNKLSLEEAARKLRYAAFREISEALAGDSSMVPVEKAPAGNGAPGDHGKNGAAGTEAVPGAAQASDTFSVSGAVQAAGAPYYIATAHHADDNAETVLFQMLRGTGYRGSLGIAPVSGNLCRPLLSVTREEIEAYLREKGQNFRTDSTNADTAYARNRIRSEIMPLLKELNPNAAVHISRTAQMLREAVREHEERMEALLSECLVEMPVEEENSHNTEEARMPEETRGRPAVLAILRKKLAAHPVDTQKEFLYLWLQRTAKNPKDIGEVHIESILPLVTGPANRRVNLPHKQEVYASHEVLCLRDTEKLQKKDVYTKKPVE